MRVLWIIPVVAVAAAIEVIVVRWLERRGGEYAGEEG